jgi:hypothetical protein
MRSQNPLRGLRFVHTNNGSRLKADFTLLRDLEPMRMRMSIRSDFANGRGAGQARPGAALVVGGLLLLIAP